MSRLPEGDWKTDMSRKSIDFRELHISLAKDAIPSIDQPRFTTVVEASKWIGAKEPVLVYKYDSGARAYPVQILLFHELVNDTVAGRPILVGFCPLCNSGIIFDRTVDGVPYEFGVSGLLRHSDMVMYDRQTDSRWQQFTGEAIVGSLTSRKLEPLTGQMVAVQTFAEAGPDGEVLARPGGSNAPYGVTHFTDYEQSLRDMLPARLPKAPPVAPLERVVTVELDGVRKAYPSSMLRGYLVYEDKIRGRAVVLFFEPAMQSTMDRRRIADSRSVGTAGVFSPTLDGERLRFRKTRDRITDKQTGSTWSILGRAVEGPLTGRRLEQVPHGVFLAFAVSAFHPKTRFIGVPLEP